jgi:hypothetical protein
MYLGVAAIRIKCCLIITRCMISISINVVRIINFSRDGQCYESLKKVLQWGVGIYVECFNRITVCIVLVSMIMISKFYHTELLQCLCALTKWYWSIFASWNVKDVDRGSFYWTKWYWSKDILLVNTSLFNKNITLAEQRVKNRELQTKMVGVRTGAAN